MRMRMVIIMSENGMVKFIPNREERNKIPRARAVLPEVLSISRFLGLTSVD